jgi:hypothetical protein
MKINLRNQSLPLSQQPTASNACNNDQVPGAREKSGGTLEKAPGT